MKMLLAVLLLFSSACAAAAMPAPDMLVRQVVNEVLATVRQDRALMHDPRRMDGFVATRILPHFDFPRMTRQTIGKRYWTAAMPQQRLQLVGEFRTLIEHGIAGIISQYTDQTVFFVPFHMRADADEVTVRTAIIDPRDEPTELAYRMEKTPMGWKIYDVDVDHIWLTRIYRSNFDATLRQGGVQGLVVALQHKNREVSRKQEDR